MFWRITEHVGSKTFGAGILPTITMNDENCRARAESAICGGAESENLLRTIACR